MKKKRGLEGFCLPPKLHTNKSILRQVVMVIKVSYVLLLITCMQLQARTYSQTITLNTKRTSLENVFKAIEQQTGYVILYNYNELQRAKPVSISATQMDIHRFLDKLLSDQPFTYTIEDKTILVTNRPAATALSINPEKAVTQLPQQRLITGSVTDETGSPLEGVTVTVDGTSAATTTNAQGNYRIQVPETGTILVFTIVGFEALKQPIGDRHTINIVLKASMSDLDEVVVVGYGSQRKRDLTGSVSSVGADQLAAYPTAGAVQALQGRAPGVAVSSVNGEPGQAPRIRIRGGTSINASSEPLYVVDGFAGGSPPPPEDIQSIDILKDASATAIYGSRGANGVVLITTKSGKAGKTQVGFSSSYSIQEIGKKLTLLNGEQFAQYINEIYQNDGSSIVPYPNPEQYGAGTNWQDAVFRTGGLGNSQLSASGGTDGIKFYTSVDYFNNKGIITNSLFDRISGMSNLDIKLNDRVRFGTKMFYLRSKSDGVLTQEPSGGSTGTGVIMAALKFEPVQDIFGPDGTYTLSQVGDPHDNPVAVARERESGRITDLFQGNAYAELDLWRDLTFRSTFGIQTNNYRTGEYIPTTLNAGRNYGGIGSIAANKQTMVINENYLTYDKRIDESNRLMVMGGYSYQFSRGEYWRASNQNFVTNSFSYWNLGGGSNYQNAASSLTEWVLSSFYGRLNYNFKDRYLLTFTGRYDGSSRFGANNKWAFFPSGAVAWNIKEEPFLRDADILSLFKIRASYGETGNTEIGSYRSLAKFSPSFTIINGNPVNAVLPTDVANANLTWESTQQTDIGIDVSFFNSRLSFTADYYNKKTMQLLYDVPLPEYSGYTTSLQNIGSLRNKGWEFALSTINLDRDFKWNTDFNISFNRNKILKLAGGDLLYSTAPGHMLSTDSQILREGQVIGAFYGWVFDGIYQTNDDFSAEPHKNPGDVRYLDITGRDAEGNLTGVPDGVVNNDDRRIIGNPHPDFVFGFNNDFRFKNFDFNVFFQGSVGNDMMNYTRLELDWMAGKSNATIDALNRWTPTNTDTDIPRASGANKSEVSSRSVEDGSYLRLKNLTIGYNIEEPKLRHLGVSTLRVYVSAQNIWTVTNYSGYDPEVSFQDSNINVGLDYGSYPNVKSWTLGVRIGF
ncbi:TonB-dependent receptor [Parapedobacter koreensis]|uniref:TonB-linked outer membrane protein, SusC/RagA family n=1 Tax=Parapedobacter koreensis TaxID=332977 RepID=A0A1H7SNV1_9SPHI|nr:TonB-dependent receptor [Parapedobacter koreensis]SEL74148.1 TonB-linked outer membrane protein, SusC/RagA family [Parapedobacter koreensis]